MLHRLQEIMHMFYFDIMYKKEREMPADYLSCNLINDILWDANELLQAQTADPLLKALEIFLPNKELPLDAKCHSLVKLFANDCFYQG